jgi:hypothetical protein
MTRSKPCCVLPSSNSAIPAAQQISVATTNTDCPFGARAAARSRPMIRWRVVPLSPFGDSGLCLGRATASRLINPRASLGDGRAGPVWHSLRGATDSRTLDRLAEELRVWQASVGTRVS